MSQVTAVARLTDKQAAREALVDEVRAVLRSFAARSVVLEPFEHGTFFDQLAHELVSARVAFGDPLAATRRARRNQKIQRAVRIKVYRRDKFTCQRCGWRSPVDLAERAVGNRSGIFLTIDHKIPKAEGGSSDAENLQTLCSRCNPQKGHTLEAV